MGTKIGEVFVDVTADLGNFNSGMKKVKSELADTAQKGSVATTGLSNGFASMALKAAGAVGGIMALKSGLSKAIKTASDFEETNNKFAVTFQDVRDEAEATAKTLQESFGMSKLEAKNLLSATGDLLSGFGATGQQALDLSSKVQSLAADLASFSNVEGGVERASQALTAGLLGEREQMKALGIVISEDAVKTRLAAEGKDKLTGQSLLLAKAEATLAIATEQSKNAIGDFARSSDSFANTMRILESRSVDLFTEIGQELLPAFNALARTFISITKDGGFFIDFLKSAARAVGFLVKGISNYINALNYAFSKVKQFHVEPLANANAKAYKRLANVIEKEYGEKAKKAGIGVLKVLEKEAAMGDKRAASLLAQNSAIFKSHQNLSGQLDGMNKNQIESLASVHDSMEKQISQIKNVGNATVSTNAQIQQSSKETRDKQIEDATAVHEERMNLMSSFSSETINFLGALSELFNVDTQNRLMEIDQRKERKIGELNATYDTEKENIKNTIKNKKKQQKALEKLEEERSKKEAQINENADKEAAKLQRKAFERQKGFAIVTAAINTAGAIIGFLANPSGPAGLALSILAGITGAIQIAAIAAQKPPALADGGIAVGETLATIGEAGTEAVFPLEGSRGRKTRQMFADDLISAIGAQQSYDTSGSLAEETDMVFNVNVNIGGERLFGVIQQGINNRNILIDERSLIRQ